MLTIGKRIEQMIIEKRKQNKMISKEYLRELSSRIQIKRIKSYQIPSFKKKYVLIIGILILIPVFLVITDYPPYSIYNTGSNGTSVLKNNLRQIGMDCKPVFADISLNLDQESTPGYIAILGASNQYSMGEIEYLSSKVYQGWTLIITDSDGIMNGLCSDFGMTVSGLDLYDSNLFQGDPTQPIITNQSLSTDPLEIQMKNPSYLVLDPNYDLEVFLWSSSDSWAETNLDGVYTSDVDIKGPFPIGAKSVFGSGSIILIADRSFLSNSALKQFNNLDFVYNVIEQSGQDQSNKIFFDERKYNYRLSLTPGFLIHSLLTHINMIIGNPFLFIIYFIIVSPFIFHQFGTMIEFPIIFKANPKEEIRIESKYDAKKREFIQKASRSKMFLLREIYEKTILNWLSMTPGLNFSKIEDDLGFFKIETILIFADFVKQLWTSETQVEEIIHFMIKMHQLQSGEFKPTGSEANQLLNIAEDFTNKLTTIKVY